MSEIKKTKFVEDFANYLVAIKLDKKLPNYLSLEEAKRVLAIYENSEDPIEIRDNAMLHIFLNCGLRLSEIKGFNVDDINMEDSKFTIIGKGNKERTNYLNEKTKVALIKYLEIRNELLKNNDDKHKDNALFLI